MPCSNVPHCGMVEVEACEAKAENQAVVEPVVGMLPMMATTMGGAGFPGGMLVGLLVRGYFPRLRSGSYCLPCTGTGLLLLRVRANSGSQ